MAAIEITTAPFPGQFKRLALQSDPKALQRALSEGVGTCGVLSLCAALGISFEKAQTQFPALASLNRSMQQTSFDEMERALVSSGTNFFVKKGLKTKELCDGIIRIQWECEWLSDSDAEEIKNPYSHWIAHHQGWVMSSIVTPFSWITLSSWDRYTEASKLKWHASHHLRIDYKKENQNGCSPVPCAA